MAYLPLVYRDFEGGWSTDLKVGIKNSFAYSQSIDFRKNPSQFTVLPGTRREDAKVIKDLVQNEVMAGDGTIYAMGNAGWIYKRTTGGVWSAETQFNAGTFGMDYRKDTDAIYTTGNKHVNLISTVSGTPTYQNQYYGPSVSTSNNTSAVGFNVNANQSSSTLTTAIQTSFTETNTNLRYFQSDIEPLQKISVYIPTKGTGNWTLTLHDGINTNLGSVTVSNANLTSGKFNDFVFTNPVRIYVTPNARTYHFHLTSTVADGTVSSTATNDLSSCDCQIYADRLIQTQNGMHPIARFQQFECIGNGNYLSVWEPISDPPTNSEWQRHKLVFPSEYEVCGLAVFNEYLAIACEKVSSNASVKPQEGIIFFWDGLSTTYNYLTKIPEGAPYSIHEYKNAIYYYAGGTWYAIGSPTSTPVKIRTMPGTDTEFSGAAAPITVNPYSATVRRGIHLMGWPSSTTSTSINYGVYSWGAIDKNFPDSFGYSYVMSTGSKNYSAQNNLTIGMVKNFNDTLHISWRDDLNGGYGMDVVDNTSAPASTASWESLIFDNSYPYKRKKAIYLGATFLTLPSDCSFMLKYKIDRAANWTFSPVFSTATPISNSFNTNRARFDIAGLSEFREIQFGIDITVGSTTPTFTSVVLIFDDTREQLAT